MSERINSLEDKFTDFYVKEVNAKFTEIETKLKTIEKNSEKNILKCTECEFSSTTERGLNTHITRKHNPVQNDYTPYPKKCEVCDKEVSSKQDMRIHMKTHSFIRPQYKCEECEFICERKMTMEVHVGKSHDINFECGLCGFLANSADNLSMHLVTCEVYICDRCTKRYKTISDLKAHYKTETIKFKKLDKVVHAKVGRTEDSEIKEGNYFKEDFCSTKI